MFFRFLILVIENITELIIVISFLLAAIDMLLRRINILSNTTKKREYIKIDRDKSTFKSHRDFDSEIEMTFKHF